MTCSGPSATSLSGAVTLSCQGSFQVPTENSCSTASPGPLPRSTRTLDGVAVTVTGAVGSAPSDTVYVSAEPPSTTVVLPSVSLICRPP